MTLLQQGVRAAHREGIVARASTHHWLPFAVHAAEVGYVYDGVEFWPIYAENTPEWIDSEYERDRVRGWFRKFSKEYGGAIPQGAWASTFRKIAWPITHAVLPRYLQVQLARMLYDYRTGWPGLLDDPEALGVRLHSWSRYYGERLEKFCQNTALLGHVAVALLLSGEDEPSPYIESSTLDRLIESLNSERQSRRWLHDARHSASKVRTRNFQRAASGGSGTGAERRPAALTDPRLQLKLQNGAWHAYAVIPDLKPLQLTLPMVYDELRNSRASVAGSKEIIRNGALMYAMAPVELSRWPSPTEPFLQLKTASTQVNLLIADQCRITRGPWWVFRRKQGEPATEVKGKFVRPGGLYCLIAAPSVSPPDVAWCEPASIAAEGVSAYSLRVPDVLSDSDCKALVTAGLSVVSDLSIQPVGVAASGWDGEGTAEWLAGEPALVMIRAEQAPKKCRLTINGDPYYVDWPPGESELFLSLEGLAVGTHEVVVALGDLDGDGRNAGGTLSVAVRDPQAPAAGMSAGEGIRLRTSPAQPSLPELWGGRAVLEIDGPQGTSTELAITLRDSDARQVGSTLRRTLDLPLSVDDWRREFDKLRQTPELSRYYDEADLAEFAIGRAGIGFATLVCERGFRGLRWVLAKCHNGTYTARLIDRTDGDAASIQFYSMDRPTSAETLSLDGEFMAPPRGGLLWATNGGQSTGQIVPPDPNQLLRIGATTPRVPGRTKSLAEVRNLITHHRRWTDAELPAHPFGVRDQQHVLQTITTAMAVMLAPGKWAHFEHQISGLAPEDVDLNRAQRLVGDTAPQWAAAQAIASRLWQWSSPEALIVGFADAIADLAASSGMPNRAKGARFLLQLASAPGEVADWDEDELNQHIRCVLTSPVLLRAARFAVLGTPDEVAGGLG
ncbi:hypothetical protein G5C66_10620 [Nocardioides sp. KC13]|uniref:Uncharacterized protein n=1 Tax=Nocardioides turkmenicus TaxID=2711220 RepID=A0A6M1R9V6_9ACTN|nr:hypothetical protein [Nocardioides sp. KC13]NGN93187.1 hypothetical protein [Nocardioides sp. KC13]